MAVRTVKRRGERRLVIDFSYVDSSGTKRRYRRDAEAQTRAEAHAEERRRLAAVAAKGSPFALVNEAAAKVEAERAPLPAGPTFGEVVEGYWSTYAPSQFKGTTRYNYRFNLDLHLLPRLKDTPLTAIDAALVRDFDAALMKNGASRSLRRQIQIVLRSVVCRYAVEAKLLSEPPRLPSLPKKSKKVPTVISTEQVLKILEVAHHREHRLALLLAFYAGLRSGEIRALRVRDVDLEANVLRIRQSMSHGILDTPKSGNDREVPLSGVLREAIIEAIAGRPRDALVSVNTKGRQWGQSTMRTMFIKLAQRAGVFAGSTFHHLRHGFVTALLERGVGAHIVQELAGHADLTTTQRYAHAIAKNKHAAIAMLNGIGAAA